MWFIILDCTAKGMSLRVVEDRGWRFKMIVFEEELKKFHQSLEIGAFEDALYNQDLTDMVDLLVNVVKETKEENAGETKE